MIVTVATGAGRLLAAMTLGHGVDLPAVYYEDESKARRALAYMCTPDEDLVGFDLDAPTPFDGVDFVIMSLQSARNDLPADTPVLRWWVTAVMPPC